MASEAGGILIVDDDAALLKVMGTYLARLGYRVTACRSASQAWELIASGSASFAAALVDLHMPGMCGEELAERVLERNPSTQIVVMSGYPATVCGVGLVDRGKVGFLQKPFAPQELAAAFRDVPR